MPAAPVWVAPALPVRLQYLAPSAPLFVVTDSGVRAWLYAYTERSGAWFLCSRALETLLLTPLGEGRGPMPRLQDLAESRGFRVAMAPGPAPVLTLSEEQVVSAMWDAAKSGEPSSLGEEGLSHLVLSRAERGLLVRLAEPSPGQLLATRLRLHLDLLEPQAAVIAYVLTDLADQCQDGIYGAVGACTRQSADEVAAQLSGAGSAELAAVLERSMQSVQGGPIRMRVANLVEYSFPADLRGAIRAEFAL